MNDTQVRAAIYCRVSTAGQVDGTSLGHQQTVCEEQARSRGWLISDVYVDRGISGTSQDRPEWQRMLADCRLGLVDAVMVLKLDRFSRSAADAIGQIRALDDLGVSFVSIADNLDLSSASGKFHLSVLAAVAELERDTIAERAVAGQRSKALSGGWPGGEAPFGYRLLGERRQARPVPDAQEREIVRTMVDGVLDRGMTTGDVAALLNAMGMTSRRGSRWTHATVRRTLEKPALHGLVVWGNPGRRHGHHTKLDRNGEPKYGEPIEMQLDDPPLDLERWELLQAVLTKRGYGSKAASKPYPNSGATSACGGRLGGVWRRDRDLRQYRCNRNKWVAGQPPECDCPRIDADWLDAKVWASLVGALSDPDQLVEMAAAHLALSEASDEVTTETLDFLDREIARRERALVETTAEYLRDGVPASLLKAAILPIDDEVSALKSRRALLKAHRAETHAVVERAARVRSIARETADAMPGMSLQRQALVLRELSASIALLDSSKSPALEVAITLPPTAGVSVPSAGNLADMGLRLHGPHRRPADPAASAAPGAPACAG